MAFGDPYTSEDGSKVISATGMLDDNSKNIRVIAADFSLDRISNIVNSSISMEGAKAFLVNKNTMQIMADRNSSYVSEKIGSSDQPEIYAQAKKEIKKATTPPKRSEKTLLHFPRLKEPIGFSFHISRQALFWPTFQN